MPFGVAHQQMARRLNDARGACARRCFRRPSTTRRCCVRGPRRRRAADRRGTRGRARRAGSGSRARGSRARAARGSSRRATPRVGRAQAAFSAGRSGRRSRSAAEPARRARTGRPLRNCASGSDTTHASLRVERQIARHPAQRPRFARRSRTTARRAHRRRTPCRRTAAGSRAAANRPADPRARVLASASGESRAGVSAKMKPFRSLSRVVRAGSKIVGRRVDRDVAGAEEAQLRGEQAARFASRRRRRRSCRRPRDGAASGNCTGTPRLAASRRWRSRLRVDVQQRRRRLREILQRRLIAVPIEQFAAGRLERARKVSRTS